MKTLLMVLAFLFATGIMTTCTVKNVKFTQECKGHLKRAADANSVSLAIAELQQALQYIENNHLTSGYTSVIYNTPDEDVEFWYTNIKASLTELTNLSPTASSFEKSNVLMKLRETLLDNTKEGTSVTYPEGIQRYPNNLLWVILNTIQMLLWIALFASLAVFTDLLDI
jgi:hypothetical protein